MTLRGVNDTEESDFTVSLIPLSPALHGIGTIDTAESEQIFFM